MLAGNSAVAVLVVAADCQQKARSAELTLAAKVATIKEMIASAFGTGDLAALSNGIVGALTKAREAIQGFDFKAIWYDIGAGFNNVVSSIQHILVKH